MPGLFQLLLAMRVESREAPLNHSFCRSPCLPMPSKKIQGKTGYDEFENVAKTLYLNQGKAAYFKCDPQAAVVVRMSRLGAM